MEFADLVQAVQSLTAEDAFGARLDIHQWRALSRYMAMDTLRAGHTLIRQGERKRNLYFLGEGHLQMTLDEAPYGRFRTELLRPGAVVGESGLFGDEPHLATVEAMTPVTIWELSFPRFEELSQRLPNLALEVMRGAGAVMTVRQRLQLARLAVHAMTRGTAPSGEPVTQSMDLAA
jgi:CRP/FNR family transcriptional regulator, cyclic AMP receptor protein